MRRLVICLPFLFCAFAAHSFNLESHALISITGHNKSIMVTDPDVAMRFGLDRLEPTAPFDNLNPIECLTGASLAIVQKNAYIDAAPSWLTVAGANPFNNSVGRCPTLYEQRSMPTPYSGLLPIGNAQNLPNGVNHVVGWFMRGAIREDDYKFGKYDNPNLTPDQDPWLDEFRSVHHFYNPITDLTGLGTLAGIFANATTSTSWAMGTTNTANQLPDPMRGNHFSYADARKAMYLALTYKRNNGIPAPDVDFQLRTNLWATTFKSLGHVVHLLQDTASPQHVRGEGHGFLCNGAWYEDATEARVPTRTFENFTNYRVTFFFDEVLRTANVSQQYSYSNFCDDEKWRRMFVASGQETPVPTTAWTTANTYPIPQFSVQRKFFTTRVEDSNPNARRGLADYTNRGFFTENAFVDNAGSPNPNLPSPPALTDPSFVPGELTNEQIPGLYAIKTLSLFWQVPDTLAPSYPDPRLINGKAPIVSRSLWLDPQLAGSVTGSLVLGGALTLRNYTQIADMTAARAVAYTAGMINFFFRGKIRVEAPVDGLFGAIDHSIPHTVDAQGYPICTTTITTPENWCTQGRIYGFTKIRVKVRNETPDIVESGTGQVVPQTMSPNAGNPSLIAVARYHRNPCYQPNLTGERTYNNTTGAVIEPLSCTSTRTNFQEISVSAPRGFSAAEINGSASVATAFDFSSDPIPINATDLQIQVIYRGQLGAEVDGIAVGAIDVREPGYITMWNNTDWGGCNGAWLQSFGVGCTPAGTTNRAITTANLCVGSQILLSHNQNLPGGGGVLGSGRYLRVAVIGDGRTLTTRARTVYGTTGITDLTSKTFVGPVRQSTREIPTAAAPYVSDPFYSKRGRIGSNRAIPVYLVSGANPQPSTDLGALDVGNLLPSFATTDLPATAEFNFPDTANSVAACPVPN